MDAKAVDAKAAEQKPEHWLRWLVPPALVLILIIVVRSLLVAPFSIPSGSMEHTLEVGDRILVNRTIDPVDIQRGDIIVFDAAKAFGITSEGGGLLRTILDAAGGLIGQGPETDYVKRVIGLPGDHIVCCDATGKLVINGVAVNEPYLYPGDKPSDNPFDVTVPAGKFWVMGDHRSLSADSRAHLGGPGGGTVPGEDIIGKVWVRYWPLGRLERIDQGQLSSVPRNGE